VDAYLGARFSRVLLLKAHRSSAGIHFPTGGTVALIVWDAEPGGSSTLWFPGSEIVEEFTCWQSQANAVG
jgi:hypothetical protein